MAELGTRCTHRKGAGRKLSAYGCARRISTRRAGHGFTGVTRERGRATCLLVTCPEWGPGDQRPWRGLGASTRPRALGGYHERTEAGKVSGRERQVKRLETDSVAVAAEHSTGEGGELRPKGPTGGSAARLTAVLAGASPAGAIPRLAP